jgi:hypothetical protein
MCVRVPWAGAVIASWGNCKEGTEAADVVTLRAMLGVSGWHVYRRQGVVQLLGLNSVCGCWTGNCNKLKEAKHWKGRTDLRRIAST